MFTDKRREMVYNLMRHGYIHSERVKEAMLMVPRELFVPYNLRSCAYVDSPLEIGEGQTISAPHMIAIMCEVLDLNEGEQVLEIGTGSGYHAAIVSKIVGVKGKVYSIERIPSLAEKAKQNLKKADIRNVEVHVGDGSLGLPEHAPYDSIYVTCAAPVIPPPLIEQLKDKGKLLVPVGSSICSLKLLEKKNNEITVTDHGGCVFVPLIGVYGH
jgi:protein-L-isoaspartate(D-aspartate) O-methyltransferase